MCAGSEPGASVSHAVLDAQIMPPKGYLAEVHAAMRAHGAICVADEVQCGFGRAGSHFWAFDAQGVMPDIVTLGKSIGNGFPMGAVVRSPATCRGNQIRDPLGSMLGSRCCSGWSHGCAAGVVELSMHTPWCEELVMSSVIVSVKKGTN